MIECTWVPMCLCTFAAAEGFFLIWAGNDRGDAGFHAAFELDASADEIALFDADLLISIYAVPANWQATTASPGADGG